MLNATIRSFLGSIAIEAAPIPIKGSYSKYTTI